ncbi:MAG: LytTR family transcriptional regulator [Chitinophagaceae bacterium]|nr:LytTR family transcriptional regulator [Chitinophagaceae bacterium]
MSDLLFVEADNNYVNIITTDKKLTVCLSLNQLPEKLHFKQLDRIHRSFAVNMNAIQSFNKQQVIVNKTEIPIGSTTAKSFYGTSILHSK